MPCPPPGDLPDPGIESVSLMPSALADRFFTTSATWEALYNIIYVYKIFIYSYTFFSYTLILISTTPLLLGKYNYYLSFMGGIGISQ